MIEVDVKLKVGAFSLEAAFANDAGITALFGQSGSGKSVTLNLIAGLMRPDKGYIRLDGEPLVDTEQGVFVPMHRRRIGLVFQDFEPFPASQRQTKFALWAVVRSSSRARNRF